MTACGPLCALLLGGGTPLPLPEDTSRIWTAVPPLWRADSPHPGLFTEDEKKSRIKAGVADGSSGQSHLPAVRAVTGVFRVTESGVKIRAVISLLRSLSPNTYCHNKKIGVNPRKGAIYGRKKEISLLPVTGKESDPGEDVLKSFVDVVSKELKNGGKIQLVGFGTFEVSERAARGFSLLLSSVAEAETSFLSETT